MLVIAASASIIAIAKRAPRIGVDRILIAKTFSSDEPL
jgi:hypothetical protein